MLERPWYGDSINIEPPPGIAYSAMRSMPLWRALSSE